MSTLNLGILAHVDAGKTSLTERLLYAAGVIDEIGSVDDGSTQTDSLALERQRGITIKSAVVSFVLGDVTVNLIDTPGHPDFIAEVERVLSVLDGAVLVISAVEGVQAQTRVLMRDAAAAAHPHPDLREQDRPRRRASDERVLRSIAEQLTPAIVADGIGAAASARAARRTSRSGAADADFTTELVELPRRPRRRVPRRVRRRRGALSYRRLRGELAGADRTGAGPPGVLRLGDHRCGRRRADRRRSRELLPATDGDADGPLSGIVFKVERGPAGEKIAYVRMFSGTVRTRDRLRRLRRRGPQGHRDQRLRAAARTSSATVGLRGADRQALGSRRHPDRRRDRPAAARPRGRATTSPRRRWRRSSCRADAADRGALHVALTQLAEQDPLINLRQDDVRQEISVSLYGEVQKEVIQATLATDFGIDVTFRETTTICIERPIGTGAAVETIGERPEPVPRDRRAARRARRRSAAAWSSGSGSSSGRCRSAFFTAVEETVRETLQQGLHGWQVTDCTVTMTHSGYCAAAEPRPPGFDKSMSSTGGDFRNLTPLVLMAALQQAGTTVYEPMHRFQLELPADTLGSVLPVLGRLRAVPQTPEIDGARRAVLEGEIPAAQVHALSSSCRRSPAARACWSPPSTATSRSAARSRPARAPTTTRSTARTTCCACSAAPRCDSRGCGASAASLEVSGVTRSVVAEVVQARVVDPEVVRDLVDDSDLHLLDHVLLGLADAQRRQAKDRDAVGQRTRVPLAALGQRGAVVHTEQLWITGWRLVLDEHRHVVHQGGELRRNEVERVADQLLEPVPGHLQHPAILPVGAHPHRRPGRTDGMGERNGDDASADDAVRRRRVRRVDHVGIELGRGVLVTLVALVGGWLGLLVGGHTDTTVGPLEVELQLAPSLTGDTLVHVPPLGSVLVDSHDGPLRLDATVEGINVVDARRIFDDPRVLEGLEGRIIADLRSGVTVLVDPRCPRRRCAARSLLGLLALRPRRRGWAAGGTALAVMLGSTGAAAVYVDRDSILEPSYTGLIASAPALFGDAQTIAANFEDYREGLVSLVSRVSRLYDVTSTLPVTRPATT